MNEYFDNSSYFEWLGERRKEKCAFVRKRATKLKEEMTIEELVMWKFLQTKPLGFLFEAQRPFRGKYIPDFSCRKAKTLIEVDGDHHKGSMKDAKRDNWFWERGYQTLRFSNDEVMTDFENVKLKILKALEYREAHQ